MIKKVKLIVLMITIIISSLVVGCSKEPDDSGIKEGLENETTQKDPDKIEEEEIVLKFWGWYSIGNALRQFEAENEGITIEEEIFSFAKCEEEYMKALTSGEGPDVLMFDSNFFSQYTVSGILQDLLQEPFLAGKYQDDFLGWESGFSIDNKQLLSITLSTAPFVTIYRSDIMKENGFPHEPEEFGKFIKEPENIIKIAEKLKEDDKYIFQYPTDLTDLTGATLGFFDDNLSYTRFGDLFELSLDVAKETHKKGLELIGNFWGEDGKKAIKEDRLVMMSIASYGMGTLKGYAPEQEGKWSVTTPPLGVTAWGSDSRIAINSQSSHKEAAWKLVEYIATHGYKNGEVFDVVPGYIPVHKSIVNMNRAESFFGGQIVYPMIEELAVNMVQYKLTPMDNKALEMYRGGVWNAAQSTMPSKDLVEKMKNDIDKELAEEKKALIE